MKAALLLSTRNILQPDVFVEIVLWRVPNPVRGSTHGYKYRLALVVENTCVLRYDNEAGKGDHKHVGNIEIPYEFVGMNRLLADFRSDVGGWLHEHGRV
jgi:hypothetical protein